MKNIASSNSLKKIIENNQIYVDKTHILFDLISNHERVFFSRPRRFGKSLTLNTIATLFEQGVDPVFKDTWIANHWTDRTYPVLNLSFLKFSVDSVKEYKRAFNNTISDFAKKLNLSDYVEDPEPNQSIQHLLDSLGDSQEIVIVIDEYDCQLTANINNEELYEEFRKCLRSFFANLKDEEKIRFLIVSGVTRLKDVSIFSVGSDIEDMTYSHLIANLTGFTKEEIKHYYHDYLILAASYLNKVNQNDVTDRMIDDTLERLAYEYNGYCFDEFYQDKVFSTWSVNCFFKALIDNKTARFGDYWYDNGGMPTILGDYLSTHSVTDIEKYVEDAVIDANYLEFKNPISLLTINQTVLMCQTGYLTLASEYQSNVKLKLSIPNNEVRRALCSLLCFKFLNKQTALDIFEKKALETGFVGQIVDVLNSILSFNDYSKNIYTSEDSIKALLVSFFIGARVGVSFEKHQIKGRSDIIIELDTRRIVIELKYVNSKAQEDQKLIEAIEQIKSRDYGNYYPKKELIRIAAVFNGADDVRAISVYEAVNP